MVLAACAWHSPKLETETRTTNGVVTVQKLSSRAVAIWPATTEVARQKMSVGKTLSLGLDGLREETGSTNMAASLKALTELLQILRP